MGVVASSRNFKKAVDRNYIKRLMREAYRLQKNDLRNALETKNLQVAVFFIFTDKSLPNFDLVYLKINECLKGLIKRMEKIQS